MKICASICEYNPLHNGHIKHLQYIKKVIKPDYTIIFLSGNFTQRGDIAVMDKYTRAKHAVLSGADAVIELPTIFATSPAEIFSLGALKLINSLKGEKTLCFGTETNDVNGLIKTAEILTNETDEFKEIIKQELKNGESYIKARITALSKTNKDIDFSYLSSPNNILGLEYVKAILKNNYDIKVMPLKREGSLYNEEKLEKELSSALAIRNAIESGNIKKVKSQVPSYVYKDLPKKLISIDELSIYSLITKTKKEISKLNDCAEGLENRIKAVVKDNFTISDLLYKLNTKRYTNARLKRLIVASLLNIESQLVKNSLNEDLYLKVLAINKDKQDVLKVLSLSDYPLITRKSQAEKLTGIKKQCFLKDVESNDLYNLLSKQHTNEYQMLII